MRIFMGIETAAIQLKFRPFFSGSRPAQPSASQRMWHSSPPAVIVSYFSHFKRQFSLSRELFF